jgi:hypothetical protein
MFLGNFIAMTAIRAAESSFESALLYFILKAFIATLVLAVQALLYKHGI